MSTNSYRTQHSSVMILWLVICSFGVGCQTAPSNYDFLVSQDSVIDAYGKIILSANSIKGMSGNDNDGWGSIRNKDITIAVSEDTTVFQLVRCFSCFNARGITCKLLMRNKHTVQFGIGCVEDYICSALYAHNVHYVAVGGCRLPVSEDVVKDDRMLVPALKRCKSQGRKRVRAY